MRAVALLACLCLTSGCAAAKIEHHQITSEETAWIQKGITTRSEIEARFGLPTFEVPEYRETTHGTSATSTPRSDGDSPTTRGNFSQSPMDTKATYVHPLFEAEISPSHETNEDRFSVVYDEKNVVKDFGFTVPPTAPPAGRTQAQPAEQ